MNTRRERFVRSRSRERRTLAAASVFCLLAAWYALSAYLEWQRHGSSVWWSLRLLAALPTGGIAFLHLWAWCHRQRPVLEVSDEEIEWGSTFHVLAARKRVSPQDVADVSQVGVSRVALRTRADETIEMNLAELAPEEQQQAFESIRRRVRRGST